MIETLRNTFTWPRLIKDVKDYYRACSECREQYTLPNERMAIDLVDPLTRT